MAEPVTADDHVCNALRHVLDALTAARAGLHAASRTGFRNEESGMAGLSKGTLLDSVARDLEFVVADLRRLVTPPGPPA